MENVWKTYVPNYKEWPVERDDLARDLFMQFAESGEYADPTELAARAFDAADAFMAEMGRRNDVDEAHRETLPPWAEE